MTAADHPQPAARWLRWITRGSIVLGLAALVATVWLVGFQTIASQLSAIGAWFVLLIALETFATLCDSTAVYFVTRGAGAPTWRNVVVAQFAGRAVNLVTPASNLGEALKVSLLARHGSPQRILAGVLYVVLVAVVVSLSLVAIGSVATVFLFGLPAQAALGMGIAAVVAAGAALAIVRLIQRGMLATVAGLAARLRLISGARRELWRERLEDVDRHLRGDAGEQHYKRAIACIAVSQLVQKALIYVTILAAGYHLSAAQLTALLSAGIVLGWLSTLIPMGLGLSEGGNIALFALFGAPASLGLVLALARRVNQILFAAIGFTVLSIDRVASHVGGRLLDPRPPVPITVPASS